MAPNPIIIRSVETLGYRVTVGDVATQAGLNVAEANLGLLALASDAGGHLQVAESGDIVYQFPRNFREVLRNKYLQLRLQEWWKKVWKVLFYLIRMFFGIFLILSITIIILTIYFILSAVNSDRDGNNRSSNSHIGLGSFYFFDLFRYFDPNYYDLSYREQNRQIRDGSNLNFFEAIFSFLFGDGNPNPDLEERRWQQIGTVIANHRGAIVAEQISPYLDDIGESYQQEYEDYMLPVLMRFNGQPKVSPEGKIIYYFPELQVSATKKGYQSIANYLEELPWRFSQASSGQIMLSAGLGGLNFVLVLILGALLKDGAIVTKLLGFVAFVQGIYGVLLAYGIGFLVIPLVRYFWIQSRNQKIASRNRNRSERANLVANADTSLQHKIEYASEFAQEKVIGKEDLAYSTETDLLEQQFQRFQQIDPGLDQSEK